MKYLNLSFAAILLISVSFFSNGQNTSPFIVTDQFGYLPDYAKIAVIRNPEVGFDASLSFTPGAKYALMNAESGDTTFIAAPLAWKNGATDASSGDKVWHFDFTSVNETGSYYVLDIQNNVRSYEFKISPSVYNEVLKHAVRTFFYQRAGFAKAAEFAGAAWADGASHMRNLQDKNARIFNKKTDATTERDVSGGWYDAGDYNKYTNWTASYVIEMMKAYIERPEVWTDDYNIPESGNGIPDLLDEAKWGIDHLLRMQLDDGSVLSIVGLSHASPPSAATGPSYYGTPNTSAALNTSAAFAIASKVYRAIGMTEYADTLVVRSEKAWNWAVANPAVIFRNNDSVYGSSGLGAGQQETNEYGRFMAKLKAACYLFEVTGKAVYRSHFDANYNKVNIFNWTFAFPFEMDNQDILLYYTTIPDGTTSVKTAIRNIYRTTMNSGAENLPAMRTQKDPYLAHIKDYTWGSNSIKCAQGSMYYSVVQYNIDANLNNESRQAATEFIHYIHGRNPLNMTYLSNMYKYGGKNCVNEFYHTWFSNNSPRWDRVGKSTFGPAPGFLTGGPNPSYNWDGCCPSGCGSASNNARCFSESIEPPKNQPNQKSYKDFNTSWPLNSWSVTENSCGYQMNYIRLLSKFVDPSYDCNGDKDGSAFIDACNVCAGGNTGRTPVTNSQNCLTSMQKNELEIQNLNIEIYPNPTSKILYISSANNTHYGLKIVNSGGKIMIDTRIEGSSTIDMEGYPTGFYLVLVQTENDFFSRKIIKL
jgi:endoglucanase